MGSKNVATRSVAFGGRVLKSFFDVRDKDSHFEMGAKVTLTGVRRLVYSVTDYWLMIVSASFVILMDQQFGYGPLGLFLLMWAFDIIVANVFIVIWKRTGEDLTLGEAYRRAADTIRNESKFAGYITFVGVVIKASFWDGPEHIVIFFNKEIKSEIRMLFILLILTAIQAAIWTPIYVLGFETASELYKYLLN